MKQIYPGLFRYLEGVKEDLEKSPEGSRCVRSVRGRRRSFGHPGVRLHGRDDKRLMQLYKCLKQMCSRKRSWSWIRPSNGSTFPSKQCCFSMTGMVLLPSRSSGACPGQDKTGDGDGGGTIGSVGSGLLLIWHDADSVTAIRWHQQG